MPGDTDSQMHGYDYIIFVIRPLIWSDLVMKMTSVRFSEAKARLSSWSRRAVAGETIVVLKHNRPAFLIAPLPDENVKHVKKPGLAKGKIRMTEDFDRTPESVIRAFEGIS